MMMTIEKNVNKKHQQNNNFLADENLRLRQQLLDAQDLIRTNKMEIQFLTKNTQQTTQDKSFTQIIFNHKQNIQKLQKTIQLLTQTIQHMTGQKLLIQKLNQQLQSQLQSQLQNQQQFFKNIIIYQSDAIKVLQNKLIQCEKTHLNYDQITGFVQRNNYLLTAKEQAIQFKNKEYQWEREISYLHQKIYGLTIKEKNLSKLNIILRKKVIDLQTTLAIPNLNLSDILDTSIKRLMIYFVEAQRRIIMGDEQVQEQQLELIAPQIKQLLDQNQFQSRQRDKSKDIPYLDILKVKPYQIKDAPLNKEDMNKKDIDKVQKLQCQLSYARREIAKYLIQLNKETKRRKILQNICQELEQRNSCLIKMQEKYLAQIENYNKELTSKQYISQSSDYEQKKFINNSLKQQFSFKQSSSIAQNIKHNQNVQTFWQKKISLRKSIQSCDQKVSNIKSQQQIDNNYRVVQPNQKRIEPTKEQL